MNLPSIVRKPSNKTVGKRQKSTRRPLAMESLEAKRLLTSTLYLDFGDGFPAAGLFMQASDLSGDFASGGIQGPDLVDSGTDGAEIQSDTQLQFDPLEGLITFDYNNDGLANAHDYTDLRRDVVELVQRYYAPFDLEVLVAPPLDNTTSETYRDGIIGALQQGPAANGEYDAWVFVSRVTRTIAGASTSVGAETGNNGIAAGADIPGFNGNATPNDRDDVAITYADVILSTPARRANAATQLAYTTAHEAAHTYGLWHTWGGIAKSVQGNMSQTPAGVGMVDVHGDIRPDLLNDGTGTFSIVDAQGIPITAGAPPAPIPQFTINASTYDEATGVTTIDVGVVSNITVAAVNNAITNSGGATIVLNYTTNSALLVGSGLIPTGIPDTGTPRENMDLFTRYPLLADYPVNFEGASTSFAPYNLLVREENLGPRDVDNDGVADLAYVTGTGAHDIITVQHDEFNKARVTIQAFSDNSHATPIPVPGSPTGSTLYEYTVDLDRPIIIDAGANDDQIIISASLGAFADITVRGMQGDDELVVTNPVGDVGSATLTPSQGFKRGLDGGEYYGGLIVAGNTTIRFDEFDKTKGGVRITDIPIVTYVTPNSSDDLTITSPGGNRSKVEGTSGGISLAPVVVENAATLVIDASANDGQDPIGGGSPSTDDTVTVTGSDSACRLHLFTGDGKDEINVQGSGAEVTIVSGAGRRCHQCRQRSFRTQHRRARLVGFRGRWKQHAEYP